VKETDLQGRGTPRLAAIRWESMFENFQPAFVIIKRDSVWG
jgi:hypothetical protein